MIMMNIIESNIFEIYIFFSRLFEFNLVNHYWLLNLMHCNLLLDQIKRINVEHLMVIFAIICQKLHICK